ncbi:hypothetical protein [Paenibacillus sp. BAC0078]
MKRLFILLFMGLTTLLSGCTNSTNDGMPNKQPESQETIMTTTSPTPTPQPVAESTMQPTEQSQVANNAEDVLKQYLDALVKKDYDTLSKFIYAENYNMTVNELTKKIEESDFQNSIERSEYMISTITDYDDTHKLAKVLIKGKSSAGEGTDNVDLGIILLNGEWKVDSSLIIKTESLDDKITNTNSNLTVTKITKVTKLNGYQFTIEYKNNLNDKRVLVGWMNNSTAVLVTDKEPVTVQLGKAYVEPNSTGKFTMEFDTPEPSIAKSLIIKGLNRSDSNNIITPGEEPFQFELQL